MTFPFDIFDKLLNEIHLYPLDAQHHITKIQAIDNKIIKRTAKLQRYFKQDLRQNKENYNSKIKQNLFRISKLNMKRKISMDFIMKISREMFSDVKREVLEQYKGDISNPTKSSSVLKTKVQREDVNTIIKQPKYCVCRSSAFGDMVRCDDPECKFLWYHYECVGLVHTPKGNWICSNCKKNKLRKTI